MSAPVISLSGVDAGYGRLAVVQALDLDVEAGEITALLGANGAGKTTVVKTITGLLPTIAGNVEVLGEPAEEWRRAHRMVKRGLAVVPDNRGLFPNLTGLAHLKLAAGRRGNPRQWVAEHLPELLPKLNRKAGLLSGGEQQMLTIARALVQEPKVLVIDEMSLGLAPMIAERLANIVQDLGRKFGLGVLLVEQHVGLALSISDKVVMLARGQVKFSGSASTLREHPELAEQIYLGEIELSGVTETPSGLEPHSPNLIPRPIVTNHNQGRRK